VKLPLLSVVVVWTTVLPGLESRVTVMVGTAGVLVPQAALSDTWPVICDMR